MRIRNPKQGQNVSEYAPYCDLRVPKESEEPVMI
jgi:hypothetical protein